MTLLVIFFHMFYVAFTVGQITLILYVPQAHSYLRNDTTAPFLLFLRVRLGKTWLRLRRGRSRVRLVPGRFGRRLLFFRRSSCIGGCGRVGAEQKLAPLPLLGRQGFVIDERIIGLNKDDVYFSFEDIIPNRREKASMD